MDHHPKILKLDGSNYSSWSYWMCNCVFDKQQLELVNGSASKPSLSDQNYTKLCSWEAKNAKALSLINDFVDPSIKKSLSVFKSAKEAWSYLARLYHVHSTLAENFRLELDMRAISHGDMSIEELQGILVSFWDKLAVMEPKDLSGLDSFKCYREEQRLVQLLVALRDDFEPLRRSMLQRSTFPSVQEAVEELISEERRLKSLLVSSKHKKVVPPPQAQLESLSLDPRFDHQVVKSHGGSNQFGGCQSAGGESSSSIDDMHSNFIGDAQVQWEISNMKPMQQSSKYHQLRLPSSETSRQVQWDILNMKPMQRSSKYHQPCLPSSETSRPASHRTPDKFLRSMVKMVAQVHSDYFGESPLESGCYLPDSDEEACNSSTAIRTLKIMSYNVWFREDIEVHKRMESIGILIQLHSPDVICFQEVTPNIYGIFKQSSWWDEYTCSISDEMACTRKYFCMQLSKLPVKYFVQKPFRNSRMGRELCVAAIEVEGVDDDDTLIVATTHLESPEPPQMHSEERVAQANEALSSPLLCKHSVIFCGDMNWDDDLDGKFPQFGTWFDAWEELRDGEEGWSYDTETNPMLLGNYRPVRKRLDRFVCKPYKFEVDAIEMIGTKAIPGVSYYKGKGKGKMELPVLHSDHYGLLLQVSI